MRWASSDCSALEGRPVCLDSNAITYQLPNQPNLLPGMGVPYPFLAAGGTQKNAKIYDFPGLAQLHCSSSSSLAVSSHSFSFASFSFSFRNVAIRSFAEVAIYYPIGRANMSQKLSAN
jgi:hypothetical protein